MDLAHRFSVPTDVGETWAHFQDIASVAECFPGAQVTEHDGDSFHGTVKVKLGPIALVYNGSGTFVEKDDAAHRFVVDAKGKDKRGNGTAGAKVTLSMTPGAAGGTDVEVLTDLAVTGKPAQFGRGVMQDVSDKLLGQFVDCLEHRLGAGEESPAPVDPVEPITGSAPQQAPGEAAGPPTATTVPAQSPHADAGTIPPPLAGLAQTPEARPAAAAPSPPPAAKAPPKTDDAINLGSTVLPILLKSYWKQGLGLLLVVAVIVVLIFAL